MSGNAGEDALREAMVRWGRLIFGRGLTPGSSGNLSARVPGGFLVTPTNACLGLLEPGRLSRLDADGRHVGGDPPTKEVPLHLAVYAGRPSAGGVVHLHSPRAVALSCLAAEDPADALPVHTPYAAMRLGRVPLLPYAPPGTDRLAPLVRAAAAAGPAMLLANHGPVAAGRDFDEAVHAAEELEDAAGLALLARALPLRRLDAAATAELDALFALR